MTCTKLPAKFFFSLTSTSFHSLETFEFHIFLFKFHQKQLVPLLQNTLKQRASHITCVRVTLQIYHLPFHHILNE